jgi:hypothetical protein
MPAFRGRGRGSEIFAAIAQFGHNHLAIASGWRSSADRVLL